VIEQADVEKINLLTDQIRPIRLGFDEGIEGTKGEFVSILIIINHLEAWAYRIESVAQRSPHDPEREAMAQACKDEVANLLNAYSEERQELLKLNFSGRNKIKLFLKESLTECDRITGELGRLTEYYFSMMKPN
jgi:hypothetical protein